MKKCCQLLLLIITRVTVRGNNSIRRSNWIFLFTKDSIFQKKSEFYLTMIECF